MGVLQPWLLALGAAVAVPLLLHLFQRHQGPRVVFPALRYLRRAEKDSARRIRLRQRLLLLVRAALVLLVALAAARPFLPGAGSAHEPAAVVIVLDNSLSTSAVSGERRLIDELRERALETLMRAGPDDRFWLLRAAARGEPALPGDAAATARRVRETEPLPATADLAGAFARARTILGAGAEGRAPEVHLLSDLQAGELRSVEATGPAPPLVVYAPRGGAPANHALVEVMAGGGLAPVQGQRAQLGVVITGTTGERDSVPVRAYLGGRLVAAARTPRNSAVLLPLPAAEAGVLTGRVETEADLLRADDVRHFALRVLPPPIVAAPDASAFLAEAVRSLAQSGRIRAGGGEPDVLVATAPATLPPVRPGRTVVVVPPGSPIELAGVNGALARAGVPWRYTALPAEGDTRLMAADTSDPLERALQGARLRQHYRLSTPSLQPADTVLLRTRAGGAWAVRGALRSGGRYILLGSPLDAEATSIPTSAAMIPLLDRIVGAWSAADAGLSAAEPGALLPLPAGATHVRRPDGVLERSGADVYAVPPAAGVYEVLAGDARIAAFAVNPPAAESDLRRARGSAVARAFRGWPLTITDDPDGWQRAGYRARLGVELWRPLVLAALLLLVAEGIIAAAGGKRKLDVAAPEAA